MKYHELVEHPVDGIELVHLQHLLDKGLDVRNVVQAGNLPERLNLVGFIVRILAFLDYQQSRRVLRERWSYNTNKKKITLNIRFLLLCLF